MFVYLVEECTSWLYLTVIKKLIKLVFWPPSGCKLRTTRFHVQIQRNKNIR